MGTSSNNLLPPQPRPERSVPLRSSAGARFGAGVLALLILAVLITAAWLTPNAEGHGSHTQLGLAPCTWAVWFDKPCPTCGMTTSFAQAGEGNWVRSGVTQPFGLLLVIGSAGVFWGSLTQAVTGAPLGTSFVGLFKPRIFISLGVLFAGAWIYKIVTW